MTASVLGEWILSGSSDHFQFHAFQESKVGFASLVLKGFRCSLWVCCSVNSPILLKQIVSSWVLWCIKVILFSRENTKEGKKKLKSFKKLVVRMCPVTAKQLFPFQKIAWSSFSLCTTALSSQTKLDYSQSLLFFRFRERSARARERQARLARGLFSISRVLLNGRRKKERLLVVQSKIGKRHVCAPGLSGRSPD